MGQLRRTGGVIILLEPPRLAGFVSGGFRYQSEIARRLAASGIGRLIVIAAADLVQAVTMLRQREPAARIVIDGLFTTLSKKPLPLGVIALLHMAPPSGWCLSPMPVITTAATTARAVAASATSVAIVRPGLDECFAPRTKVRSSAALRIVCVGTVSPLKGQAMLAAAILRSGVACELLLIGDVASHPDYVAQVRAAAGTLTLRLLHVLSPEAVAEAFATADLAVSASRHESFGMAVAEAVACGVPVLAFATGEIGSSVCDGENGWLLPVDASEAQFERAVHDLLRAPARLATARAHSMRPSLGSWDAAADEFARACALAQLR